MVLPNFFVIGAGRSGTTSLHHYLGQHPQIYMAKVKSPSYFFCRDLPRIQDKYTRLITDDYFVRDYVEYQSLFDKVDKEKAIGEVSPVYLASTSVAKNIATEVPDAKIIAILRNPVDRVYARFVGRRRDGFEVEQNFASLVAKEKQQPLVRENAFATYLPSGYVYHFLKTYFDVFPRRNIKVYIFEEFMKDLDAGLRDIFTFLKVDANIAVDTSQRYNSSAHDIQNPILQKIWRKSSVLRTRIRPYVSRSIRDKVFPLLAKKKSHKRSLDKNLRSELLKLYLEDIDKLENLLERDLSLWLK